MSDDEIIGLKSTAIKFKKNLKMFVTINYFITIALLLLIFYESITFNFMTFFLILFILSLVFQILFTNFRDPGKCLLSFKFNNVSALILFLGILSINN